MLLSYVIILYCNVGRCVKDGVVHRSCQQSLVAKWPMLQLGLGHRLGLGLGPGNGIISFFGGAPPPDTPTSLKWQRHLCCSPSTLTV